MLVAEHRPDVPEPLRLMPQRPVLDRRPHHRRRTLQPKGAAALAPVEEVVHLLQFRPPTPREGHPPAIAQAPSGPTRFITLLPRRCQDRGRNLTALLIARSPYGHP